MTDGVREQNWPILQSEDLVFLRKTREELEALLETSSRWTELMKNLVRAIPREQGGREVFGQDPLGRGLLAGVPTGEVDAVLADEAPQKRLRALIEAIDKRIAELMPGPSPEEPSARRPKHAA